MVTRSTIRRRYSAEPTMARPLSATPRTETDTLPLMELVRAPSLPLIGDANRLTSSTSIPNDSIDDEDSQKEFLLMK